MNAAVFLCGLTYILLIPSAGCYYMDSDQIACPKQVTGKVYGEVTILCYYSTISPANKNPRKYCCLQGKRPGACGATIVSNAYKSDLFGDLIELVDNTDKGFFTVTISRLEKKNEGVYICGIGLNSENIKNTFSLSVVDDSVVTKGAELVYTQLRGTVLLHCSYDEGAAARKKHLCKVTESGCIKVIDSTGETSAGYEGRVTGERQAGGTFKVKMAQVQVKDTGFYVCGSDDPEESRNSPTFDVRICRETDIPQGSRLLTPKLGGSFSAQCNYNPKKEYKQKFWCKLEDGTCNPIITADGYVMDREEGRVVLHDNTTAGLMQVLMNNITAKDAGYYWCVFTGEEFDQTSSIHVRISEDRENIPELSGSKTIEATVGDTVKMQCFYPCRFKTDVKYWCLWNNHGCQPLTNVEDTQDPQSLSCLTEQLVLTIKSVSQKNSGYYICGVRYDARYGGTIAVRLLVNEPNSGVSNTNARANFAGDSRNVHVVDSTPSTDNNKSSTITAATVSVCGVILVACAVFIFFRLRKRKNSDLVSVGSYRTNISMTDLDQNIGKENPVVTDVETNVSHSKDSPKNKKKGSREDLDYSCLINHVGTPHEQVA